MHVGAVNVFLLYYCIKSGVGNINANVGYKQTSFKRVALALIFLLYISAQVSPPQEKLSGPSGLVQVPLLRDLSRHCFFLGSIYLTHTLKRL